jgi:hypothetical protein
MLGYARFELTGPLSLWQRVCVWFGRSGWHSYRADPNSVPETGAEHE